MTRDVALGVWVGRDDDRPFPEAYIGGRLPARIARAILEEAGKDGLLEKAGNRPGIRPPEWAADWPPVPFGRGDDGGRPDEAFAWSQDPLNDPAVEAGVQAVVDMIDAGGDSNGDLW